MKQKHFQSLFLVFDALLFKFDLFFLILVEESLLICSDLRSTTNRPNQPWTESLLRGEQLKGPGQFVQKTALINVKK